MSDQDFFFDDEDAAPEQPASKSAAKPAAKPAAAKGSPAASRPRAGAVPAGGQSVTMTVAGLIGVVALLVGIIIGILIPTGSPQVGSPAATVPTNMGESGEARPLSPEELQGDLPPGHPPIGEMGEGMTPPATEDTETAAPEGESE